MSDYQILVIKLLEMILHVVYYSTRTKDIVDGDRVRVTLAQASSYQESRTRLINSMADSGSPKWGDTDDYGGHT